MLQNNFEIIFSRFYYIGSNPIKSCYFSKSIEVTTDHVHVMLLHCAKKSDILNTYALLQMASLFISSSTPSVILVFRFTAIKSRENYS